MASRLLRATPATRLPGGERLWQAPQAAIALLAAAALLAHGIVRLGWSPAAADWPLWIAIGGGGLPLVWVIGRQLVAGVFGTDVLAGVAIVAAVLEREVLVAVVIVLMLSGGQALEEYATRRASALLEALARRTPSVAHCRRGDLVVTVPLDVVEPGDELEILPHEICPADGIVVAGHSRMDESYISGEPFLVAKTVGASVISGAINGDDALTVRAVRRPVDSRFARIASLVSDAEQRRPRLRRLGDRLGAWYTPIALTVAAGAWAASGSAERFLAVIVIATPCPLLLAIPIAILGAMSLAASRGILIRNPTLLERASSCRTAVLDKTGTLTLGRPEVVAVITVGASTRPQVLAFAASLEQYSKHPLAAAVLQAADAEHLARQQVDAINETPGRGLTGRIAGHVVALIGRAQASAVDATKLPPSAGGLECVVLIDEQAAGLLQFRDAPRRESAPFVRHLAPRHGITRLVLTSGDRDSEVRYMADLAGISEVHAGQLPEDKVRLVEAAVREAPTLYIGDGLNDAPAMLAATVSVALGQQQDVAGEAADAVVLDASLAKVDELLHIARRTMRIAVESAVGGMALSVVGMALAAGGWLAPIAGAAAQEVIDIAAVLNALRAASAPRSLTDYD